MAAHSSLDKTSVPRWHPYLLLSASAMTYLLITMGGIVCVTQSARGCPDWPGCFGQVVPPMQIDAIIEYLHRLIAGLTSPVIILAAIVGRSNPARWVRRPPALAIVFLIAVIAFGAAAVVHGIPPWMAAIDLGSALIVFALVLTACVVAFTRRDNPNLPDRLSFRSPFDRLALWTMGAVFVVLVSGVLVASSGSTTRCLGWPLYGQGNALGDLQGWLQMARRLIAIVASILIVVLVIQAWRTHRRRAAIMRTAAVVGGLFVVQIAVGVLLVTNGAVVQLAIYVATAAALWAGTVILAVLAGLTAPASAEERLRSVQPTESAI